jgi:hypothetical protein
MSGSAAPQKDSFFFDLKKRIHFHRKGNRELYSSTHLFITARAKTSRILRVKESRQCASKQAQGSQKGPKFAEVRGWW